MIKIAFWIIRILFWLQAFAAPMLVFGFVSFVVYSKGAIGVIAGTVLAEWIRRKYGLDTFFSKIYGSPELDDP